MLQRLLIENLTLVEKLELEIGKGLVCITGETGAGKSALIHALYLLSGQKVKKEKVRQGEEKAKVEGVFQITNQPKLKGLLEKWDIEDFDDEVSIYREVTATGKSKTRINGTPVTQTALAEIGSTLIQLHGQSEQTRLKNLHYHLQLFDLFANPESELKAYQKERERWSAKQKEIEAFEKTFLEKKDQRDFIEYQLKELRKANLKENEEEELQIELKELEGSNDLRQLKDAALDTLRDRSPSIFTHLDVLKETLQEIEVLQPHFKETNKKVEDAGFLLEEVLDEVEKIRIPESVSVHYIDELNTRLSKLQMLQRKFHTDMAGLLSLLEEREKDLLQIDGFEEALQDLIDERKKIEKELQTFADQLTQKRMKSIPAFQSKISELIQGMGMPGARFEIRAETSKDNFPLMGQEVFEFWIEANKGEGMKPLRSTLSGGELSRVMLAIKSLMAGTLRVPVLVFDEVDAGISGEVGHKVATVLSALGEGHQVFAITHLHQVASPAKVHIQVKKEESGDRTLSKASVLTPEERVIEIARMLGGTAQKETLEHAKSLLGQA